MFGACIELGLRPMGIDEDDGIKGRIRVSVGSWGGVGVGVGEGEGGGVGGGVGGGWG